MNKYLKLFLTVLAAGVGAWAVAAQTPATADLALYIGVAAAAGTLLGGLQESPVRRKKWSSANREEKLK